MGGNRSRIGVSKLAAYAADPGGTLRRRGRPRSRAAVRHGDRAHSSARYWGRGGRWFPAGVVLAAAVMAVIWWFGPDRIGALFDWIGAQIGTLVPRR